jgi:nicotinamide-nucleotide amidase
MKTVEIIATGNELIQGEVVNTNAAYISQELTRKGFNPIYHTTVADEVVLLRGVIEKALGRVNLVIATGGLGPTKDDVTREAVSLACHRKLVLDREALAHIQNLFRCRHQEMPESNLRQAMLPEGATLIPNRIGTAPGFSISHSGKEIICLPGVPGEMKRMFQEWVLPHLERLTPQKRHTLLKKIHVFGLPEALVGERLVHLMTHEANPRVGTMVHEGIITLRLQAEAEEEARARGMLEGVEEEIRRLLGEAVFGVEEEHLEEAVASLLMRHGLTIAVAESCTGGLVCDLLTNVPGISNHLLEGMVVYTPKAKALLTGLTEERIEKRGMVNPEITILLASAIRGRTGADIGLAVTGVAGPTSPYPDVPVGLVYVALATRRDRAEALSGDVACDLVSHDKCVVKEFRLTGTRKWIKLLAAKHALNVVRLSLMRCP